MKKMTSLHEAAHVVTAYLSKFHFLFGPISLTSNTNGEAFVTLSRSKLTKQSKQFTNDIVHDPEIIEDLAIIFFAGLEAEKIYCEKQTIKLDSSFSINDYNYIDRLIADAKPQFLVSKDYLVSHSHNIVEKNWIAIDKISEEILNASNNSLNAVDAIEILDNFYNRNFLHNG